MKLTEAQAALEAFDREDVYGRHRDGWTGADITRARLLAALDAARAAEAETCPTCGGTGSVYDSADVEPVLRECESCHGTGKASEGREP